jgi:hypothetical protein
VNVIAKSMRDLLLEGKSFHERVCRAVSSKQCIFGVRGGWFLNVSLYARDDMDSCIAFLDSLQLRNLSQPSRPIVMAASCSWHCDTHPEL